jgi:hypothetical protein
MGAVFAEFWKPLLWSLGLVPLITALWVTVLWLGALRRAA